MNYPQSGIQKPSPTFGGLQQNFAYNLRNFRMNDSFTIVEDLPMNKPLRQKTKMSLKPNARTGKPEPYNVFAIRIVSSNFEADLELFEGELNTLAIACPKDLKNLRGVSLAFDGMKWQYTFQDTNEPLVSSSAKRPEGMQSMQSDPRQPNLYANPASQVDQKELFYQKLVSSIQALNTIGTDVTSGDMIKIADKITPGDALGLIAAAKMAGYIIESNGIFKVA